MATGRPGIGGLPRSLYRRPAWDRRASSRHSRPGSQWRCWSRPAALLGETRQGRAPGGPQDLLSFATPWLMQGQTPRRPGQASCRPPRCSWTCACPRPPTGQPDPQPRRSRRRPCPTGSQAKRYRTRRVVCRGPRARTTVWGGGARSARMGARCRSRLCRLQARHKLPAPSRVRRGRRGACRWSRRSWLLLIFDFLVASLLLL
mmetsp:Transcript_59017/g.157815  ORF Transcript_59017/g.157815 Transcript_59017/m.157815 type:complete len:203 (-) Transcript_59017:126-734(-)